MKACRIHHFAPPDVISFEDVARPQAVNVGTALPLADARVAHEMLEGARSRPRGKIVLTVE
jgi:hypothetical protein